MCTVVTNKNQTKRTKTVEIDADLIVCNKKISIWSGLQISLNGSKQSDKRWVISEINSYDRQWH